MPLSAAQRVRATDRAVRCLQLVRDGRSYEEVAEAVGYSHRSSTRKAVLRTLESHVMQGVEELRELEGDRLDALQAALWGKAMAGDLRAVDSVLRIIDRRVALLGLRANKQQSADVRYTIVRRGQSQY
jgi:hypothetical protein